MSERSLAAAFARRPMLPAVALAMVLAFLAMARPIDHDESQYVAAAMLSGEGLLPYRDYAYLQTPLQPLLFGPLAKWFAAAAYPGLRFVNAALGALAILFVFRAARAGGGSDRIAAAVAGLFAATDILLFGTGLARNDALPAALFAAAVWLIVAGEGRPRRAGHAFAIGLLLAAATAAKASYALPAAAYGLWALFVRDDRPHWVAAGALIPAALVAWSAAQAIDAFIFGVFTFPTVAPGQYFAASDRAYKLTLAMRLVDTLKFLALGAALPALVVVARAAFAKRRPARLDRLLELLIAAGLLAAILPEPTWRQYLLPMLPPLFVRLARAWAVRPPGGGVRIGVAVFAAAGLAPSATALAMAARTGLPMSQAMRDGEAAGRALDDAGAFGPVATLSPQFLAAARRLPDPRFATGPFYFRSRDLLTEEQERRFHLISADRLDGAILPATVLLGGEAGWAAGDPALDERLARAARTRVAGVLRVNGGRFRVLTLRPPGQTTVTAGGRAAISAE